MSFVLDLQRAVLHSALQPPARHIVLTLAVKANWDTGVIPEEHSPALETLVAMTGLAKSTVAEWLDALETGGWVKRERPDKATKHTRTRYTLLIGSPTVAAPQRASRRRPAWPATAVPAPEPVTSPPGGLLDPDTSHAVVPSGNRPPDGPVRQPDYSSSPHSGTPAVRHADGSSPPGGPATTKNSPTGSSPPNHVRERTRTTTRNDTARRRRTGGRRPDPAPEGIALPADFAVDESMIDWAREHTPNVGRAETGAFVDYYRAQSGPRAVRRDLDAWALTWRIWMRRSQADIERRPGFRGKAVQTAVDPAPTALPSDEPMCPRHPDSKAQWCCPGAVRATAQLAQATTDDRSEFDAHTA